MGCFLPKNYDSSAKVSGEPRMSDTPAHEEFTPDLNHGRDVLQPYDAREREGLPPMIKLALVAIGLLVLAFIVMKLYQPGVRDRSDPPRITADNTPFKVPPKDAGGAQTPNQDKVVFEVMDGQSPSTEATPQPLPENPIKIEAPEPVVTEPVTSAPVITPPVRPAPTTAPRPVVTRPASGNSEWVVQVASVRSESDAGNIWARIQGKFPGLVSGSFSDIKRVDLGDKGIYYRLRVSGLADKSAADSMCASLKAGGQDCLVTRR